MEWSSHRLPVIYGTIRNFSEGTDENLEKPQAGFAVLHAKVWTLDLLNMKQEC
jgi:hypothetical protein